MAPRLVQEHWLTGNVFLNQDLCSIDRTMDAAAPRPCDELCTCATEVAARDVRQRPEAIMTKRRPRPALYASGVALVLAVWFPAASSAGPVPSTQRWLVDKAAARDIGATGQTTGPSSPGGEAARARQADAATAPLLWWTTGGPAYRWNEMIVEELLNGFVIAPLALRHLALLHAAIDDAISMAWESSAASRGDIAKKTSSGSARSIEVPAAYVAAGVVAREVGAYLFPARAKAFEEKAAEALRVLTGAGVVTPAKAAIGQEIGRKVAALAIERGKRDGSDAVWSGEVPKGPGHWTGSNPIAPLAGTWQPWILASQNEFRPAPPPAVDSEQATAALAELKTFARTPKTNHRATYWEVFGGARIHALWNETARQKLLEQQPRFDDRTAARTLAALNVALIDAAIACWDAKYTYWYIRPSQRDPELKTVFPPPNHPSYPAAHGCLSTAAAGVLAGLFPADRERLLAHGKEAAEARVWAGIHYRFDIDAGQEIGRRVAAKTLARAFEIPSR
jgi:hypothetical protein